jgi:hypothetical protein
MVRWQEMRRLEELFRYLNAELFNPVGLNLLWPRKVAFLFVSFGVRVKTDETDEILD